MVAVCAFCSVQSILHQAEKKMVTAVMLLLLALVPVVTATDSPSDYYPYESLGVDIDAVFHKYNPAHRSNEPGVFPAPLPVSVAATLHHIHGPDVANQEVKAVIGLVIQWKDTRLYWNAQNWLPLVTTWLDNLWHPYMVYDNSVHNSEQPSKPKVAIYNDSLIVWKRLDTVTTFCYPPESPGNENEFTCNIILDFPMLEEAFSDVTFVKDSHFQNMAWHINVFGQVRDVNSTANLVLSLTRR